MFGFFLEGAYWMVEIQLYIEDIKLDLKLLILSRLPELVWNTFAVLKFLKLLFNKDEYMISGSWLTFSEYKTYSTVHIL